MSPHLTISLEDTEDNAPKELWRFFSGFHDYMHIIFNFKHFYMHFGAYFL